MTPARAPQWLAAAALGALSLAVAFFVRGHAAPAPLHYFAYDQVAYLAMARAPLSDDPQVHHRPYSWRPLVPLMARTIRDLAGGPDRAFLVLMFVTFALLPGATLWWLAGLHVTPSAARVAAAAMALAPPIVGLFAWDVVRVDAFALLLMFVLAGTTVRGHWRWLYVVIVALALTKEVVFVGLAFVACWGWLVDRRALRHSLIGAGLAVLIRSVLVPWMWPADPRFAFDNVAVVHAVLTSLSPLYVFRRLLLATSGTWNLLLPLVACRLVRVPMRREELALALGIAASYGQMVFAGDNARIVAVAYPFVLALAAFELEALPAVTRSWVAAMAVLGQIPWLLTFGRVWPAPPPGGELPHFPAIRFVEVAVMAGSVSAATIVLSRRARIRTAPA